MKKEYIKYRLDRSKESLDAASSSLELGHLHTAINRIYYACFYVVSALLLTEGLTSSKHGGVMSLFNKNWIKTGRLPLELGEFYKEAFKLRQIGDYDDMVVFEPEEVRESLDQAIKFVEQITIAVTENIDHD